MEGVENRLHETHDDISVPSSDKARRESTIVDTEGIEVVVIPPRDLVKQLDGSVQGALCDQKMEIVWPSGPWMGMPITGYCDEPLCITEGVCTGTRFVPHIDQWTTKDTRLRRRRTPDPKEIVLAVRSFANRAALQTGRNEDREDKEILRHVRQNWEKTIQHIRGKGDWRQS
jgi:hypothetical protein